MTFFAFRNKNHRSITHAKSNIEFSQGLKCIIFLEFRGLEGFLPFVENGDLEKKRLNSKVLHYN